MRRFVGLVADTMPKFVQRKGFVLTGLGIAILIWISQGARRMDDGPDYQGRPLSTWVSFIESPWWSHADRSSPLFLQTSNAIVQIGTNGLPCLLRWIQYEPSPLLLVGAEAIDEVDHLLPSWEVFDVVGEWFRREFVRAESAAVALEILGESAAGLVPELKLVASEGESRWASGRAMYVLPSLGPAALPALLELASSTNSLVRCRAICGLGRMKTEGAPALPLLLKWLDDPDLDCVQAAANALGNLRIQPESVIPALINKLQSPIEEVRSAAAYSLARFGTNAWPALSAIRTASLSPYCLTNVIESIAPAAEAVGAARPE